MLRRRFSHARIRIVTCALAMVFTSLMPASAQGPDFTGIDVPGASFTLPRGINPEGDIVGFYGVGAATHGFLLRQGAFIDIDVPGASSTLAGGINARGDIVGNYAAGGTTHGYLLDKDGGLTTIDVPGASATEALTIGPQGHILGQYTAGGINHGFLAR
jgi:uncharacterized membrane protein